MERPVIKLDSPPEWAVEQVERFVGKARGRVPEGAYVSVPPIGGPLPIPDHIQALDHSRTTKAMMVAVASCSKCRKYVPRGEDDLREVEFEFEGVPFRLRLCPDCWEHEGLPADGPES
jgi:hypothetical protein